MSTHNTTVGLAEAARILRIPYQQAHRLLLVGVLRGEKRRGRWYVTSASVRRFTKSRVLSRLVHVRNAEVSNGPE